MDTEIKRTPKVSKKAPKESNGEDRETRGAVVADETERLFKVPDYASSMIVEAWMEALREMQRRGDVDDLPVAFRATMQPDGSLHLVRVDLPVGVVLVSPAGKNHAPLETRVVRGGKILMESDPLESTISEDVSMRKRLVVQEDGSLKVDR